MILLDCLKNFNDFYYMSNPGNLGDCVITASTYQFFDSEKFNYKIFNKVPNEPFYLVYSGGGVWIRDYRDCYQKTLEIFKDKNLKKCVILPSSFNNCTDLINVLDERFIVFAREEKSFDYLKKSNIKSQVYLADDMVINADISELQKGVKNIYLVSNNLFENLKIYRKFYLRVDKKIKKALKKYDNLKIGYFLRDDVEKTVENKPFNNFDLSNCKSADWSNKKLAYAMSKIFIDTIDKFEIVVTDRLHVAICAVKLNKKVFLIDNSYGKNSAVYNYSLKNKENVFFVNYEYLKKVNFI